MEHELRNWLDRLADSTLIIEMSERTGFGEADWFGISIRKAQLTSCAATCCDVRMEVTTTLPRPPEAWVMCPAFTHAERLRRSFVSVHPNC